MALPNTVNSIPIGAPLLLAANVEYALPARACIIVTSGPCETSQTFGGTYAAHTSGQYGLGNFIRCAAPATVTCKRL
jgi:hypothetical protein